MVGKYQGLLLGLRTYTKDGKTYHVYDVFCAGKKDSETGLYSTECNIVSIREESPVIDKPKANMQVEFYGETKQGKTGIYVVYSNIEAV